MESYDPSSLVDWSGTTYRLHNWLTNRATFASDRAVVRGAIGRLQQAATEAVTTLQRNLTCGTPSVEVRAATAILDQAVKAIELFDVVERVERLEAGLAASSES